MIPDPMQTLRDLVLRWNRRFSLVSRQDPARQTDELIEECLVSGRLLADVLAGWADGPALRYIDLGSGGGFPGLIWHHLFTQDQRLATSFLGSHLIEPRSKRAWFLEQASRAMGLRGLDVVEESWAPSVPPCSDFGEPGLTVISMKALHLTDEQVCSALSSYAPGCFSSDVVVVRFVAGWGGDPLCVDPPAPEPVWDTLGCSSAPAHLAVPYSSRRSGSVLLLSVFPSD